MSQNPHLTSLPAPRPEILAPKDLTHETGTGDLFRLPEVQGAIKGDFIVLPCDLVCELDGTLLADAWMVEQAGFPGAVAGSQEIGGKTAFGAGGELVGRRGGLGVWYQTKGEGSKKGEETDFIATTPMPTPIVPAPVDSIRRDIANLVYSVPTDTLNDITEENKTFPVRHSLIRKHARVRMLTTHRDAHIYFFPYWVGGQKRVGRRALVTSLVCARSSREATMPPLRDRRSSKRRSMSPDTAAHTLAPPLQTVPAHPRFSLRAFSVHPAFLKAQSRLHRDRNSQFPPSSHTYSHLRLQILSSAVSTPHTSSLPSRSASPSCQKTAHHPSPLRTRSHHQPHIRYPRSAEWRLRTAYLQTTST
jgi:hypothetical protein